MANDPLTPANSPEPVAPATDDYQAFSEVLSASARGRAFLAEHARRSRSAETRTLLAAVSRIEAIVQDKTASPAGVPRDEITVLIAAIRRARPEIEASPLPEQAAKLVRLLDLLERRLAVLAEPAAAAKPASTAHATKVPAPAERAQLPVTSEAPSPADAKPSSDATPASPDPLSAIRLLSEAERIALFT